MYASMQRLLWERSTTLPQILAEHSLCLLFFHIVGLQSISSVGQLIIPSPQKSFWFFHRTAVGITVHLGYGPTVYYSRRLTARAHLFRCLLASYMLLSSSPSQEQSAVQESVFIWRKAKNIRKVKPSFSEKATFCQTSFSPLALPKFLEKKTIFLTSRHQPYHLLLHNLTQGWST